MFDKPASRQLDYLNDKRLQELTKHMRVERSADINTDTDTYFSGFAGFVRHDGHGLFFQRWRHTRASPAGGNLLNLKKTVN